MRLAIDRRHQTARLRQGARAGRESGHGVGEQIVTRIAEPIHRLRAYQQRVSRIDAARDTHHDAFDARSLSDGSRAPAPGSRKTSAHRSPRVAGSAGTYGKRSYRRSSSMRPAAAAAPERHGAEIRSARASIAHRISRSWSAASAPATAVRDRSRSRSAAAPNEYRSDSAMRFPFSEISA